MARPEATAGKSKPKKKSSGSKRGVKTRRKSASTIAKKASEGPPAAVPVGRLERTRRLLLAALRVWELKRRVRE